TAVVVEHALDPEPARRPVGTVGDDRRVLHRDAHLVVEAVGHPAAHLERLQLAAVQAPVERMVDVVALFPRAQPRLEVDGRPGCGRGRGRFEQQLGIHNSISMPSWATSTPCMRSVFRCALSSSRIGLLLLMWMSTLRGTRSVASVATMPP